MFLNRGITFHPFGIRKPVNTTEHTRFSHPHAKPRDRKITIQAVALLILITAIIRPVSTVKAAPIINVP
jgi:hypothetical protein